MTVITGISCCGVAIEISQIMLLIHTIQYFGVAYNARDTDCFLMMIISTTTMSRRMTVPTNTKLETDAIKTIVCNFSIPIHEVA